MAAASLREEGCADGSLLVLGRELRGGGLFEVGWSMLLSGCRWNERTSAPKERSLVSCTDGIGEQESVFVMTDSNQESAR